MFKLALSPTFWAEVKATIVDENGKSIPISFDCQYKRLLISEVNALQERIRSEGLTDAEIIPELVVGFRKIQDDDDSEMKFSTEALQKLCEFGLAGAMSATFFASQPKARIKN